jgi:dTDP-4-amino-4,6-dideoxygalactose transaminase
VLEHGRFILGPEVAELESRLAAFAGSRHCLACSSGTDALLMALLAWGIGPGDAVFVPAFSFFATAEAVALLGATPVPVDIDPADFNISPKNLALALEALSCSTAGKPPLYPIPAQARGTSSRPEAMIPKAVIPVDLFGQPADYEALLPLAEKNGLLVLEDAAQAFGARYKGKRTCGLGGGAAATSFFPAKPLGCYGDGGAVFTDDAELAGVLRSIRVHGQGRDKYDNVRVGLNGRMDTLQAAILLAKLEIFEEELAARDRLAGMYTERLAEIPGLRLPRVAAGRKSVWAQYSILVAGGRRDSLAAALKARGIPTNIYYPVPLHQAGALKRLGYAPEDMPVALAASREILALPFHPYLGEAELDGITIAIREILL